MYSYKTNFLIYQQNFLGIKYYYLLSIDQNGVKILNSYDQVTQFEFKDIIKIFPIAQDSVQNLQIQVVDKQFDQKYHCESLNSMIGAYLTCLDTHIEKSKEFMFRTIQQGFKEFELEQKITSVSQKSYYNISMKLFRSHLRANLIKKKIDEKNYSIIFRTHNVQDQNLFYVIEYYQIEKIISTHWGFQIVMKNSNQIYSFNCLQHEKKVKILNIITKESLKYFGIELRIHNESEVFYLNSFISKSQINKFFKITTAVKRNEFNDLIKLQLTMNDSYIYELIDNQIINKIDIQNILKVSESNDGFNQLLLNYQSGEQIRYILKTKNKYSFYSQLQGIIDDQNDQQIQRQNNNILAIGNFRFKDFYINDFNIYGEDSSAFENLFIKKLLQDDVNFGSPQFKEILYFITINFQCTKIHNLITVNDFLNRFSKQISTFFSVKNLIKKRSQTQQDIISNLFQQFKVQKEQIIMNDFKNEKIKSIDVGQQYVQLKEKSEQLLDFNKSINEQLDVFRVSYAIWEVFIYFFNDSTFYGEIAQNFNSQKKNKNFVLLFQNLFKMFFQEKNTIMGYISGKFLQKFIYFRRQNLKTETLNKNILLCRYSDIDFLSSVAKFLQKILLFGDQAKDFINDNLIQIEAILDIFLIMVFKKKNSTLQTDLQNLLQLISNAYFFQCFVYFSYTNEPEILFKTSLLMNSIIECLSEREKVQNYQSLILHNSTLLLRHIEFCVSQVSLKQKQSSILLIYHCLIENSDAGALMRRLLPESIFNCVIENYQDTSKWSLNMWEDLFRILNQDHNTAVVQWNSDTRKELLSIIDNEIYEFQNQLKPIQQYRRKIILKEMLQERKFILSKETEEEILQLQWNYEEYHVKYSSLQKRFPVYKYYLTELFEDNQPNAKLLDNNIKNPKKFYDELVNTFIVSESTLVKNKILKVLILLYQEYHNRIKDSSLITILIKYLYLDSYDSINYLFLQLLSTFLNVPDKHLAFQNYNRFLDAEGIENIIHYIQRNSNLLDTNQLDYDVCIANYNNFRKEQKLERSESISQNNKEFSFCQKLYSKNFQMIFCYLKEPLKQEAYNQIYQRSNELILCIRILKSCINMCRRQQERALLMYPKPLAKKIIYKKQTIRFIQNLLLFNNDVLLNEVLTFVNDAFLDKFHFKKFIKNKWVVPLLIYKINENTVEAIGTFLKKVLENLIASESYQIVQALNEIKDMKIQAEINDLKIYAPNNQKKISSNLQQVFDAFEGLYYLTPYFWHVLMQKGVQKFKKRLMNYSNKGLLVWSEDAFNSLKKKLSEILLPLNDQSYQHEYQPYQVKFSFCNELTCGPLVLKNWIIQDRKIQSINLEDCQAFFDMLQANMCHVTNQIMNVRFSIKTLEHLLKDLHILMDAQAVLFKNNDKLEATTFVNISRFIKFYLLFDIQDRKDSIKDIENFDQSFEPNDEELRLASSVNLQDREHHGSAKLNESSKKSFAKKNTAEDIKATYPILDMQNSLFLKQIKRDYLDLLQFVLINCLKLLRYILRPGKVSNKNFKVFITQKDLILDLMLLMQDRVNDVIEDSFNFTFNRFKINVSFICLILNIFEHNGYDLQCFDQITQGKCFGIGHILTNLDTNIINVYINFLIQKNQDKEEIQDKLTVIDDLKNKAIDEIEKDEGEEIQGDLNVIQDILERSLNKNKNNELKNDSKQSKGEDEEDELVSLEDSMQTGSFQLLSPMYVESKRNNFFRVLPLSMKNVMTEKNKKPETEQEKTILVKIKEIKQCSFKQLVKKLQLDELRKETAGFDLSRTIIDQKFFEDLRPEYSMIYHEVKNLVHEQLKSWVLIVYKLSKNSKNCEQMIKTGLANHCFTLSLVYQVKRNFKDQKLFFNINIFAKMCYKAFYNVLLFSIMSTLVSDNTENKELKQKLHSKLFTKLINMSEIIEVDKQFLTRYFQIMQNSFGKEVLTKLFMNNNNYIEKIMKSLGTKDEIISEKRLNKIVELFNQQLRYNLIHRSFNEFAILRNRSVSDLEQIDEQQINIFKSH